jgi:phosphatidylglycerophosphatase C
LTVLDLLTHAWDSEGPLPLAFDGDGTLWTGDVAEQVWHALLSEKLVRGEAHEALVREAEAASVDASGDVHELCARIYQAYLGGRFDEMRICEIQAWAFAGWTPAEVGAFVGRVLFGGDDPLDRRWIGETRALVRAAQARGAPVWVVSASPKLVVERAVRPLGVDPEHVLGSRVLLRDGVVLPDVERPICYGAGKVEALRRVLGDAPVLAAFGDNVFDVPMLRHARIAVMVRPKPRLLATADAASFRRLPEQQGFS